MFGKHNMRPIWYCDCGFNTSVSAQANRHMEVFENTKHDDLPDDRCPICGIRGVLTIHKELTCPVCLVIIPLVREQILTIRARSGY